MRWIRDFLGGLFVGSANMIPGVFAGTDDIPGFCPPMGRRLPGWLPFLLGGALGITFFGGLLGRLMELFPMGAAFLCLGLTVGGIFVLGLRLEAGPPPGRRWLAALLLGIGFSLGAGLLSQLEWTQLSGGALTPGVFLLLMLAGAACAFCTTLPEMNGALALLVFGSYGLVFRPMSGLLLLAPVLLGGGAGIWAAARFSGGRYLPIFRFAALGISVGALYPLYQSARFRLNMRGAVSIGALLAGVIFSLVLGLMQRRLRRPPLEGLKSGGVPANGRPANSAAGRIAD